MGPQAISEKELRTLFDAIDDDKSGDVSSKQTRLPSLFFCVANVHCLLRMFGHDSNLQRLARQLTSWRHLCGDRADLRSLPRGRQGRQIRPEILRTAEGL